MGLVRNLSLTFLAQIFSQGLGIVTGFILMGLMDKEVKGPYDWLLQAPPLMMALCNLGFSSAMTYLGGSGKASVARLGGLGLTLGVVVGSLGALVAMPYLFMERVPGVPAWLIPVAMLMVPLLLVRSFLNTILLIGNRIARYNIVEVSLPLSFALALLVIVGPLGLQDDDQQLVIGCVLARVLAVTIAVATAAWFASQFVKLRPNLDRPLFKQAWEKGRWAYGVAAITELNARFGMVVLLPVLLAWSLAPGDDAGVRAGLGLFSVSLTFADLLRNLPLAVEPVLFRRVAGANQDSTRLTPIVSRNLLLLGILAGVCVLIAAPFVIRLINESYMGSADPLWALVIGTIALCVTKTIHADLMGRGRLELPFWNTLVGFLALTVLAVVLVPKLGILGMALAMGGSQVLQAIGAILIYRTVAGVPAYLLVIPQHEDLELYKRAWAMIMRLDQK